MCLGLDYAGRFKAAEDEAATRALSDALAELHNKHDVDCDNIQQYVLSLGDKSTLTLIFLPASSPTCVCYMYPIDPVCLGENDKHLIPSDALPCQAAMLDGIRNPGKYVPLPRVVEVAIYRSLDTNSKSATTAIPEVTLPEGSCVKNADDSVTFTLKLSQIVKSDAEIDAAIAAGQFPDRVAYNLAMGKACVEELLRNMKKNDVETKYLFAMRTDDPTQMDPHAMINFLEMLLPNLISGKDIIVGVPAFDEGGKAKSAAFSLWFRHPENIEQLPLLGLVHNVDPSDESPLSRVEGNFYVVTNKTRFIHAVDDSGERTRDLCLRAHDSFRPVVQETYQSGHDTYAMCEGDSSPRYDYSAWFKACSAFQGRCQSSVWDSLEELVRKNGLPGFDKSVMLIANLKDMEFPKKTTTMALCHKTANDESVTKRVKHPTVVDMGEIDFDDVVKNENAIMSEDDKRIVETQQGLDKVHSILSRIASPTWDESIVALVKAMDGSYFDDDAIGLSRFRLDRMTDAHASSLLLFLETITGAA